MNPLKPPKTYFINKCVYIHLCLSHFEGFSLYRIKNKENMKKEDLKAISKRMDENNEFENWVASVIDIRLEENDYELDELLECDNEKEVLFMLKEQWDELHNPDYFPEDDE